MFQLGKMVAAGFAPWWVHPHINSTSIQEDKFIFLLPKIEDNIVRMMKQNHTKRVYFSFFNTLNVTGELEIQSLGWVYYDGGELAMGQNRYHLER